MGGDGLCPGLIDAVSEAIDKVVFSHGIVRNCGVIANGSFDI